jgi:hypothetical protein
MDVSDDICDPAGRVIGSADEVRGAGVRRG